MSRNGVQNLASSMPSFDGTRSIVTEPQSGFISRGLSEFSNSVLANTAAIALWERQWLNLDEEPLANDDSVLLAKLFM